MKTCDVLSVPNGMATYDDNQNVGSNATIQCDSGYTLEGPSMLTCQEDETWSRSGFACVGRLMRKGLESLLKHMFQIVTCYLY